MITKSLLRARSGLYNALRFQCPVRHMASGYGHAPAMREAHMNDVPIPSEKFEDGYRRRQVGNNFVLAFGILFSSLSFFYIRSTGVIFMNPMPPKVDIKWPEPSSKQ